MEPADAVVALAAEAPDLAVGVAGQVGVVAVAGQAAGSAWAEETVAVAPAGLLEAWFAEPPGGARVPVGVEEPDAEPSAAGLPFAVVPPSVERPSVVPFAVEPPSAVVAQPFAVAPFAAEQAIGAEEFVERLEAPQGAVLPEEAWERLGAAWPEVAQVGGRLVVVQQAAAEVQKAAAVPVPPGGGNWLPRSPAPLHHKYYRLNCLPS